MKKKIIEISIIILTGLAIQLIYSYISEKNNNKVVAEGRVFRYESSPDEIITYLSIKDNIQNIFSSPKFMEISMKMCKEGIKETFKEAYENVFRDSSFITFKETFKDSSFDDFFRTNFEPIHDQKEYIDAFNNSFKKNMNKINFDEFVLYNNRTDEMWMFSIENKSKEKLLENLLLTLPPTFKNIDYRLISTCPHKEQHNNFTSNGVIEIGILPPSCKVTIILWAYLGYENPISKEEAKEYVEKYTILTQGNRKISIKYPIEVSGLYAWNKKHNNIFCIIGFILVLAILYFGNTFTIKDRLKKIINKFRKLNNQNGRNS